MNAPTSGLGSARLGRMSNGALEGDEGRPQ